MELFMAKLNSQETTFWCNLLRIYGHASGKKYTVHKTGYKSKEIGSNVVGHYFSHLMYR